MNKTKLLSLVAVCLLAMLSLAATIKYYHEASEVTAPNITTNHIVLLEQPSQTDYSYAKLSSVLAWIQSGISGGTITNINVTYATNNYLTVTNLTVFNGKTTYQTNTYLYTTNVYANYITNQVLWTTNVYASYITNNYLYTTNVYATYITNGYLYSTNITSTYLTNTYLYTTNVYAEYITNNYAYITNLTVNNLTVLNNTVIEPSVWGSSTGAVSFTKQDQYRATYTPVSITGFTDKPATNVANAMITITNASSSNITVYLPGGVVIPERTTTVTISNASQGMLSLRYHPNAGTNGVFRQF